MQRFNSNAQKFSVRGIRIYLSEIYCFIRYGCSPDDYFRYQFYRKSSYERNKFITYRRSQRIINQYNDKSYIKCFGDKALFNTTFREYIAREWIDVKKCSPDEFRNFVITHDEVLMKPTKGGQGKGIFKLTASGLLDFEIEEHRDFIAEEVIKQHSQLAKLNPTSVNTVRVLTFKGKVIACALRIGGKGAVVDNLHSNGVCAHLNIETGMIDSACINNQLEYFLVHPDTGVQLVGYRVPRWDDVIATAETAATVVPQVQYVGWDIAVTEDGTALIEGNHDPGHDVVQMIAQTGLYKEIRNLEKKH